jgi:hypothetical protein
MLKKTPPGVSFLPLIRFCRMLTGIWEDLAKRIEVVDVKSGKADEETYYERCD